MTPNVMVQNLTDEELEKELYKLSFEAATEILRRFKTIKTDLAETKTQLNRAVKEATISDKIVEDFKKLNRELIDDYTNQLERLVEAESRLAYYEGDDE